MDADAIGAHFRRLRQEEQALIQKITEFEAREREHSVVVETLGPLDKSRKCFHMVGGILVEKTAGDVLPEITSSLRNLTEVVRGLRAKLAAKSAERAEFQREHGITVTSGGPASAPDSGAASEGGGPAGVLVG